MKQAKRAGLAEVLPTHTAALFDAAVKRSAELLRAGDLVALPTETVYGLAANALDPRAVEAIFRAKGRPAENPVIVHVASLEMARACVADWPSEASALARAFWPGPLTLVLKRAACVPDAVTAGGPTVGIRWPSHPFIQAVIRECGFPLAAPSANPANRISPTNPDHVLRAMGDKVRLIVDGGQSQVGIESTVLDLTERPFQVLRPGIVRVESLRAALASGESGGATTVIADSGGNAPEGRLRSPGRLLRHYSPRARLRVLSWRDPADLQKQAAALGHAPGRVHVIAHSIIPGGEPWGRVSVIPHDSEAFARALYAELHACDEQGAELILVEAPPRSDEWQAVWDRLNRAAS